MFYGATMGHLGRFGHSGALWVVLGHFGMFGDIFSSSCEIWVDSGKCWVFCAVLEHFGQVWGILGRFVLFRGI